MPKDPTVGSFSGAASSEPLGTEAERIESAREQARSARVAQGLPPVDDGPYGAEWQKRRKKRR